MPSGKTHDRITMWAVPPAAMAAWALTHVWADAAVASLGLVFGGLMFGPDLDLKSRQYYRWGVVRWIWWPYQKLFRHRSTFTHGLLLGLPVRLLYVSVVFGALVLTGIALANTYAMPVPWRLWVHEVRRINLSSHPDRWGAGLVGVWLGGALHTWSDGLVSGFKRISKGRRRAG